MKTGTFYMLSAALILCNPILLFGYPLPFVKKDIFKFQSSAYHVAANFPVKYEEEITSQETDNGRVFILKVSCTLNTDLYMLSVTKHPELLTEPLKLAEMSLHSFVKALNGEIKSQYSFYYDRFEGKEATIFMTEKNTYAHYRVLMVGKLQYQVIVVDGNEKLSTNVTDFFDSFKIP